MDYQKPNNSKNDEPNKKSHKVEKVVVGEVITRKLPLGTRVKAVFFGGEVRGVAQYLTAEVLLPALRNLLVESASKGVEKLVYGNDQPKRGSRPNYSPTTNFAKNQAYYNYSTSPASRPPVHRGVRQSRSGGLGEQFIVQQRGEAETVLGLMQEIVDKYQSVSVSDLKEMLGLKSEPQDNNWGWVYLQDATIRQVREGYLLEFPSPDEI